MSQPDNSALNSASDAEALPLKSLTLLIRDLQTPRPWIFWVDLIGCVIVANIGLYVCSPFLEIMVRNPGIGAAGFLLSVFAFYRASYFNHEIAHQSRRLPGFEIVWNLLIGIPLLIPSFLYSDHRNHHSIRSFGTQSDAEYLAPHMRGVWGAAALMAGCFLFPVLYFVRFALLAPAAWTSPRLRSWVDARVSSLGLLGLSRRAPPTANERMSWRIQEAACFFYLLGAGAGLLTGLIPIDLVLHFSAVMVAVLFLHGIRIMAGHRYESDGSRQSHLQQVLDSFNFTHNRPVTWVMVPLGFHLHALHHLFPNVPYHHMPEAHRRIAAALPQDSPYHAVESKSYFREVLRFLFRGRDPLIQNAKVMARPPTVLLCESHDDRSV